jgi:aspartyl-tRNA(Asn)/glutamyl-tRNA(Gln) amidotransferase subunit A
MNLPLTIHETQKGLSAKKFSAVELVDSYLARINAFDKNLNSFITVSDDLAYTQAKKVDLLIRELGNVAFERYPLLGAIVAHKDLFLTKGLRTTAASKVLTNYTPSYSAHVVKRLSRAGCIIIGKTNCDAWAHGASGENSDFGDTKNPWNNKFVSGGSSSGSAVSVSANFSLIATGTDTGGSIRCPANFCGVVGLKPTYGAVSRYGVIAMGSSLDSVGHLTHSVDDVDRVFRATRGEDGYDSTIKTPHPKIKNQKGKTKYKIGVPREYFTQGLNEEVKKAVLKSAKTLQDNGADLIDISLPHTKYAVSVYYIVQPAEVSSNLNRYDGIRYGNDRSAFGDEAKRRIMLGTYVLSAGYYDAYYAKAMKVRSKIIDDFSRVFAKVDAIISPVMPTAAFKIGEKAKDPLQMYLADIFTVSASLAGIPALAIPCGFSNDNLPLGFQLMGPRFSEHLLFQLGKIYESAVNWKPTIAKLT